MRERGRVRVDVDVRGFVGVEWVRWVRDGGLLG